MSDNPGRRFRPPYPAGSCRKDAEKPSYPMGKHRKWKQYSGRKFFGYFSGEFLRVPCAFRWETVENHRKKSEKVPAGILLPSSSVFPVRSSGMRRKCTGSRRFLPYVFVLGMSTNNQYTLYSKKFKGTCSQCIICLILK
jgi:hypothetical protein